ncbi:MAG: protein-L-isoaspartate O-methyltransferase [Pseudomonadota bacterium]
MIDFDAARRAMVDTQVRPSDVTRYQIIEALLWAPRERFVPAARRETAYADAEIALGGGRALLAPRTFAKMLEAARIGPGDLVLDLAPACGYSTAVIARLAEAVVAIEPDDTLRGTAQEMLDALEVVNAAVSAGDPSEGDAAHGPYDVIFVNGAVETLPVALSDQLKDGGRLVAIFAEGPVGRCRVLTRAGTAISERWVFDASAPVLPGFAKNEAFEF